MPSTMGRIRAASLVAGEIRRLVINGIASGTRRLSIGLQTIMINSIFNGWRMEDVWLERRHPRVDALAHQHFRHADADRVGLDQDLTGPRRRHVDVFERRRIAGAPQQDGLRRLRPESALGDNRVTQNPEPAVDLDLNHVARLHPQRRLAREADPFRRAG